MRQKAAIVFLMLHFVTATELHQMVRIPILFAHYSEHRQNAAISFWDFMVLHYASDTHQDQESHSSLPFHDTCQISLHALWLAIPDMQAITLTDLYEHFVEKIDLPNLLLPSNSGQSIWQPPRA